MRLFLLRLQVNQTFGGGGRVYRRHRRAVRRSEGSTTISQRSKRDRDTEPDLIRNQDILRKISTTKKLPRSFVMGSEASERSEKNPFTTSKATQRGTVTFPSTSTSSAADALRSIFSYTSAVFYTESTPAAHLPPLADRREGGGMGGGRVAGERSREIMN